MKQIDLTRAIGVLANLGVILGIVLLAVEIHQNTEMMEAQISQARTETAMAEAQSVYDSEYLLPLMEAIDQGQPLTTTDRLRFAHYLRAFNRNQDNQLWQYRRGLLGENIPRSIRLSAQGTGTAALSKRDLGIHKGSLYRRLHCDGRRNHRGILG